MTFRAVSEQFPCAPTIAGIAIKKDASHVGLIYADGEEVRLLHFAFHFDLRDHLLPTDHDYYWDSLGLSTDNQLQAAAYFSTVVAASTGVAVPYGIDVASALARLQPDGSLIPFPIGKGFTCATFVVAALEGSGFVPVRIESWRARESDVEWQNEIIERLIIHGQAAGEHIEAMREDVGSIRLRPAEVAGACRQAGWPKDFQDAVALAEMVLADLGR